MTRATVIVGQSTNSIASGGGTLPLVKANSGALYQVYIDTNSDLAFRKSTDAGLSWSLGVVIFTGTVQACSIFYDRSAGLSTDLIHCAYTETGGSDTLYRTINTASSDALSTETTIFAGTSAASGGRLSIARSRGGNVYCDTCIDAGAEGGFFKLLNANVPNGAWEAALTSPEALATTDQIILQPGHAADNNDMMASFWDASANEVSRYVYDDSANTWAETSIATSMTDTAATVNFPHFAGAVDLANSRNLLVAWSNVDTANADLRCWYITEAAITEVTNVVLNSVDDQGLCAIAIDTTNDYWYVFYGGKSDGSETWPTATKIYYKQSTDHGTTWGSETLVSGSETYNPRWLSCAPRYSSGGFVVAWHDNSLAETRVSVELAAAGTVAFQAINPVMGLGTMKKNVASQKIGIQMVSATDGSAFTSAVTVAVTGDAGTQATGSVGSGACTHEGNGYHTYAPAQAETNYDLIAFTFTGTGAVPATVQVFTSFPMTGDPFARLGAPAGASVSADIATKATQTSVDTVDDFLDTEMPALTTAVAAVKTKTDQLVFTTANQIDARTRTFGGTAVLGTGVSGDKWRGS